MVARHLIALVKHGNNKALVDTKALSPYDYHMQEGKMCMKREILAKCRGCDKMINIRASRWRCCSNECFNKVGKFTTTNTDSIPVTVVKEAKKGHEYPKLKKLRKVGQQKRKLAKSKNFFESREWLELRYRVLKLHGRVCMCCGDTKGPIQVDHIRPRSKHPELALNISNLQVLCRPCNLGKSNKDTTDFRPATTPAPVVLPPVMILRNKG